MDTEEPAVLEAARQTGVPYASFANRILKMDGAGDLKKIVPEKYARERSVLPLFRDGKVLAVALLDPAPPLLEELKELSGLDIQPFLTTKGQLARALDESYR